MARVYEKAALASYSPTAKDLAWAAGFIEGEGTMDWDRGRGRIAANQVTREPLEWLLSMFGGHIYSRMPTEGIGKKRVYNWIATGPRARGIMFSLFSFLTERRREQIKSALGVTRKEG